MTSNPTSDAPTTTSAPKAHATKPIKLVALDLDGTIVDHDLNISAPTMSLLQHLINKTDVKVVIATGRMYPSALPYAQKIGITTPLISYQGAVIRTMDTEAKFIHHTPVPLDIARHVIDVLRHHKVSVNLYVNDVLYTNHDNQLATVYAQVAGITPIKTENLHDHLTAAPCKMMAIDSDDNRINEVYRILQQEFPDQLTFCRSRPNFCEVISKETSKWNAIDVLAKQYGLDPSEIMAIGDQENDISMLEGAGMGVAMGQAPDHVKAVANHITDTIDNDGARKAIEQFVNV